MDNEQENLLLIAFRQITEKERAMVLALTQRCASGIEAKPPTNQVIIGYQRSRK